MAVGAIVMGRSTMARELDHGTGCIGSPWHHSLLEGSGHALDSNGVLSMA